MTRSFYDIAVELDEFARLANPTDEQVHSLLEYLAQDAYARYFFKTLANPAWARPLHKNGIFSRVPPPLEDSNNPGYFSMPAWHAGQYLERMATSFPEIVRDVALTLETDNSGAIRVMLEALLKIPPSTAAETVSAYQKWTQTPFSRLMMLPNEMGQIMERLAKGDQVPAALVTLEVLLEPVASDDLYGEGTIVASSRHDFFWLNKACQENLPALTEVAPISVGGIAEKHLVSAIELEHDPRIPEGDKRLNSFWRLSIGPRSEANYEGDYKNLLVNILLRALGKACELDHPEVRRTLARLMSSEYSILRRITLYVLRRWGQQYSDLLEPVYLSAFVNPVRASASEFRSFLAAQYSHLPAYIQRIELSRAYALPHVERMETAVENHPARFTGETRDDKRRTYIERWHLNQLYPFREYLRGEDAAYYRSLLDKYKEPAPMPEEGVVVSSWEGPKSPIALADLSKKTIADVVSYLQSYVPSAKTSFGEPSREGLGRTLENDVEARTNDYADGALLFAKDKLPFVYHTHFLRALENAVKSQVKFSLSNVMPLCEFIVAQLKDEFPKEEDEEGLPGAKLAVANLMAELLRAKNTGLVKDLLERGAEIILTLLSQDDPFLDHEEDPSFDPATRSLNSIHGMAMHCIILYGLYCERQRKKDKAAPQSPMMVPLVRKVLSEKLDIARNPSPAMHSVFGWYFPQLIYLDKTWATENRERIFPLAAEEFKYWRAAWSAYIRFSDLFTNVFPHLLPQYRRAIEELQSRETELVSAGEDQQLATHILKAFLLGLIALHSEDRLVDMYYEKSGDDTRSHGNFWLSQALEAQKPDSEDPVWQKIWSLWQWRIARTTEASDRSRYVKEVTSFCRLLKNVPLELPELYPLLRHTLEFKAEGYEMQLIVEYLGRNCEKHAPLAISMLREIVLSGRENYLLAETRDNVQRILLSAGQADANTKEEAVQIINILGERGDYEWRPLLAGLQ